MQTPTSRAANPLMLALMGLGIQVVWGALLGISLQARSIQLAPGNALVAYSHLATIGACFAAIVQLIVGVWSDTRRRNGSRRIEFYLFGCITGAIAIGFFYGAQTFTALTLAYVALQLGINFAIGPYQAVIPDFVERARTGVTSSWMAALQSIGNAIGAVLASVLSAAWAIAASIDVLLVGGGVATCAYLRRLDTLQSESESPAHVLSGITMPFVDLFCSRFLIYMGFFTLVGYLLFYVSGVLNVGDLAAARLRSGIFILIFTILSAAGAALAARPSDRMNKVHVATVGLVGMVIALAVFIASHAMVWAAFAVSLAGLGWGVFLVADWALGCRIVPRGAAGTTMGVWNLALIVPQMAAPLFTAALLQRLGMTGAAQGPRVAFALAIGETVLGIAWLWRLSHCANRE